MHNKSLIRRKFLTKKKQTVFFSCAILHMSKDKKNYVYLKFVMCKKAVSSTDQLGSQHIMSPVLIFCVLIALAAGKPDSLLCTHKIRWLQWQLQCNNDFSYHIFIWFLIYLPTYQTIYRSLLSFQQSAGHRIKIQCCHPHIFLCQSPKTLGTL